MRTLLSFLALISLPLVTLAQTPSVPATTFNTVYGCGTTVVQRATNPPAGEAWYWQTSASGTSTALGNSASISRTSTGDLYLRARRTSSPLNWSSTSQAVGTVTVYTVAPSAPASSTGASCFNDGSATLAVAAVAGATSYRWYQQSSGGTFQSGVTGTTYTPYGTSTTTYYVSALSGGCESASRRAVTLTVIAKPVITATNGTGTLNMGGSVTLQLGDTYSSYSWRNELNAETGTSATFTTSTPGRYHVVVTKTGVTGTGTSLSFKVGYGYENQSINYMVMNTLQVPGITDLAEVNALTAWQNQQTIQYFDGLGRPVQTVTTQGSPDKKDLVQPTVYDQFGREHRAYLPVVFDNNGRYKPALLDGSGDYTGSASNTYDNNTTGKIAQDARPFSETLFEASPLNRPLKSYGPGDPWGPAAGNRFTEKQYRVNTSSTDSSNTAEKIIAWRVDETLVRPVRSSSVSQYVVTGGYYATGTLTINVSVDEDQHIVREYTDHLGRTVLKKVQAKDLAAQNLNNATAWALTYYVYDEYGNLRFVLPPELSKLAHQSDTAVMNSARLAAWAFRYTYDTRNRMIEKKVPGAGTVYMVYDVRNRLVATQDAVQRPNGYWTFTKYDSLNRPVLTGIKDTTALLSQANMQAGVDAHYAKAWARYGEGYSGSGPVHGYTNKSYPVVTSATALDVNRYLTVTYYDRYTFLSAWTGSYSYMDDNLSTTRNGVTYSQPDAAFARVNGQVTGTKVKVLDGGVTGGGTWLKTVNYYDDDYRVIQVVTDNYKQGRDRITNVYDFTGKVLKTKSSHEEYDVTWKDLTAGVGRAGERLYRSTGGSSDDHGAASAATLPANTDGWFEFTHSNGNTLYIGFSDVNSNASYTTIDYCLRVGGSSAYAALVSGGSQVVPGTHVIGDVFRIERVSGTVRIRKNGTVVHTFSGTSTSALLVDVSFNGGQSSVLYARASFTSSAHDVVRQFDYDHAGRLVNVWHTLDAQDSVLLVHNEYNELGQLIDKKLHSTESDGSDAKQSIDYRYNIRGWLTAINDAALSADISDPAKDFFGMELGYTQALGISNAALYKGNISGVKWSNYLKTDGVNEKAYTYSYDPMNRIKTSVFKEKESSWTTPSNSGNQETGFTYDLNGNILTLQRNDRRASGWMDNLSYDYGNGTAASNRLLKVTDSGDKTKGFVDGAGTLDDYAYDSNGNLVVDANKTGVDAVMNGSFDSGNANWTVTDALSRFTFTSGELRVVAGASGTSNIRQSGFTRSVPYVIVIDIERTAGSLLVGIGGSGDVTLTTTGVHVLSVMAGSGNTDLRISAGATFAGKIKSVSVNGATTISYNFLNLPEIVTRAGDKQLQYIYDATGRKLKQDVTKSGVLEKSTDYAGEYIYENDTLQFINHEEGRIVPGPVPGSPDWEYQYHLKDHLGNVRMTFTTKFHAKVATMETARTGEESGEFIYYNEAVKINSALFDHTNSGSTNYAVRLTGSATERYGLAKSLRVMPGDTVRATVYAKYLDTNSGNWTTALNNLMTAIANGSAPAGTVVDGGLSGSTGGETPAPASLLNKSSETGTAPKAYLNYLVFDDDMTTVLDGGFIRISEAAREYGQDGAHETLFTELLITERGYVYLYLSNDTYALGGPLTEVYFDDFTVEHISPVIQADDYYAFGLTFNSYSRENSTPNNYLYNSKELQNELSLDVYDYGARSYDPAIGRWWQIDPLSEVARRWTPYQYCYNNPIRFIDPDGMLVNDYGVDDQGNVSLLKETDDKFDRLYKVDDKGGKVDLKNDGNKDNDFVKVDDQSILPELSTKNSDGVSVAKSENTGDVAKVWKFAADNTSVEWVMTSYKEGSEKMSAVATMHETDLSPGPKKLDIDPKSITGTIHSHPGAKEVKHEMSSMGAWGKNQYISPSDWSKAVNMADPNTQAMPYPYQVYFPASKNVYNVTPSGPKLNKKK